MLSPTYCLILAIIVSPLTVRTDDVSSKLEALERLDGDEDSLCTLDNNSTLRLCMTKPVPIVNEKYFITATIVTWYKYSNHEILNGRFVFSAFQRMCYVDGWKYCLYHTSLPRNPQDWDCGCISRTCAKTSPNKTVTFRFAWHIKAVKNEYHGETVRGFIEGFETIYYDTTVMDVVQFSSKPNTDDKNEVKFCHGQSLRLVWTYTPRSNAIQKAYLVQFVGWYYITNKKRVDLAAIKWDDNNKNHTAVFKFKDNVAVEITPNRDEFTLQVRNHLVDFSVPIVIEVGFDRKKYTSWARRMQSLYLAAFMFHKGSLKSLKQQAVKARDQPFDESTKDSSTIGSAKTTMATTEMIPCFEYPDEDPYLSELKDNITLVPLKPPRSTMEISIDITRLVSGQLMLICSIKSEQTFLGAPPINLTVASKLVGKNIVKTGETLQTTKHNTLTVHMLVLYTKNVVYMCRAEGITMMCLDDNSTLKQIIEVNETDFTKTLRDWKRDDNLLQYFLKTFIVLSAGMWTVSNMLQHMQQIAQRKRMLAIAEEKEFRRTLGGAADIYSNDEDSEQLDV